MSLPSRFAGFDRPDELVADGTLTPTQKVSALYAWRNAIKVMRRTSQAEADRHAELAEAIDRAIAEIGGAWRRRP